jgi:FAT domain
MAIHLILTTIITINSYLHYQTLTLPGMQIQSGRKLLAQSYLKQGEWQTALQRGDWKPEHVRDALNSYSASTIATPTKRGIHRLLQTLKSSLHLLHSKIETDL